MRGLAGFFETGETAVIRGERGFGIRCLVRALEVSIFVL